MSERLIKRFRKSSAMAAFTAGLLRRALRLKSGAPVIVALPGGRTPLALLKVLAASALPWERIHFFMSDERLASAGSRHSNFEQARRRLFSKIRIPAGNLHPAAGAAAYEKELRRIAGPAGIIDLVILGLGTDGHTASLFPGSPALAGTKRLVSRSLAPAAAGPRRRITLTASAINRAATVVLMAAGAEKKEVFGAAVRSCRGIPAGQLKPRGDYFLLFSEIE